MDKAQNGYSVPEGGLYLCGGLRIDGFFTQPSSNGLLIISLQKSFLNFQIPFSLTYSFSQIPQPIKALVCPSRGIAPEEISVPASFGIFTVRVNINNAGQGYQNMQVFGRCFFSMPVGGIMVFKMETALDSFPSLKQVRNHLSRRKYQGRATTARSALLPASVPGNSRRPAAAFLMASISSESTGFLLPVA
jgi:hypothetical protein